MVTPGEMQGASVFVCLPLLQAFKRIQKRHIRDFLGGPVVKTLLPMKGVRVQSLVREIRSHMPHGKAEKKKEKKDIHGTMTT